MNFSLYDSKSLFTIAQAAFLWCERNIPANVAAALFEKERNSLRVFDGALGIRSEPLIREMEVHMVEQYPADVQAVYFALEENLTQTFGRVEREDLIAFAKNRGQRPAFLFPEVRNHGTTPQKKRGPKPDKKRQIIIAYMKERVEKNKDVSFDEVISGMNKRKINHQDYSKKTMQNWLSLIKRIPANPGN